MSDNKIPIPKDKIKTIKTSSAALSIGKNGITEALIKEIKLQLKKERILKIKIQKSLLEDLDRDRKSLAEEIVKKTDSTLLEIRGNTFVIYK